MSNIERDPEDNQNTKNFFTIQTLITLSFRIQPNQIINTTLATIALKSKDRSCNPADPIRVNQPVQSNQ